MKSKSGFFLFLMIGILGCDQSKVKDGKLEITSDAGIQKIKLIDLKSQAIDFKNYSGKTIFINFWATWCKPCREEMPSIQKAMGIVKDENIVFLFASEETPEQIEEFKASHEYDFNYVRVENLSELNIMALPATFIFNPEGKLVFSEIGFRQWDEKSNIDLLLNPTK